MGKNLAAVCVAMTLIGAVPAFAQDGGPSADNVKVRLGPLMMNPTISISNIGIDHNVFNVAPEKGPVQDFTFTVAPNTDLWLRVGRTWVTGSINESINWYQKYAGERTANNEYKLGWNVPTSFVQLKLNGSYVAARERPGFEIDTRAARKTIDFNGSVDFQTLPKTFIGATASRIIATGVGSTAFFGSVAAIAANPPMWADTTTADVTEAAQPVSGESYTATAPPSTTMVLERVARTFYVDQAGNPVAPPNSTTTTAVPPAQTNSMRRVAAAVGLLAPAGEPAPGVPRSTNASAAVAPAAGAPAPAAPAPAPAPAPAAPAPTPTAPPITAAPAPKPTTPPTTVPACKTSKC